MDKVPVSVLIPVYNEEKNISRCLRSVEWAGEIFVVDSGSTDSTVKIAEQAGAKIIQFEYNGTWPKKKNWALDNLPFLYDWIFILDADEVVSDGAAYELMEICTENDRGYDGYFVNRRFMFMGKWLKHSYYPNWILRLFRQGAGRFEKLTDSYTDSGDVEIHEHIILDGRAGYLKFELDHYAFPTVDEFIKKHNRYSNWEAHVALDKYMKETSASDLKANEVGWRRRLKRISHRMPFRPLLRFLYVYIAQRGFLDGVEGYYFARLHAVYEFLCLCKTYELKKNNKP